MQSRFALIRCAIVVALIGTFLVGSPAFSAEEKGELKGKLDCVTKKFKTFVIKTKQGPEVVKYTEKTVIENSDAKDVGKLSPGVGLIVKYTMKDGDRIADVVKLNVIKVDPKDLIDVKEMAELVEKGPDKGNFKLFDARPKKRYEEGHIPYAESLPANKFEKLADKMLPEDKEKLLVFYCGGFT